MFLVGFVAFLALVAVVILFFLQFTDGYGRRERLLGWAGVSITVLLVLAIFFFALTGAPL